MLFQGVGFLLVDLDAMGTKVRDVHTNPVVYLNRYGTPEASLNLKTAHISPS